MSYAGTGAKLAAALGTIASLGYGTSRYATRSARPMKRKFKRRKMYKRRSSRISRPVQGLKKQVKQLKRLAEADMGTHVHRTRIAHDLDSAVNSQNSDSDGVIAKGLLEAVIAQLRYYDPSNPGTLLVADGGTGTFQNEFYFEKVHTRITVRNNYITPCWVSVYACLVIADTDKTPFAAFQQGLVDLSNVAETSPLTYLTDSQIFKDLWRIDSSKKVLLEAGQSCQMTYTSKPFHYDPSLVDSHTQAFQRNFRGMSWHVNVEGIVAHDSLVDDQGIMQASVDVKIDVTYIVKYPAGADIKFVFVADASDTFTNTPIISNKPIASNQTYTVGLGL